MLSITYNPYTDLKNWLRIARLYPKDFQLTEEYPFDRVIPLDEHRIDDIVRSLPADIRTSFERMASQLMAEWAGMEESTLRSICAFLGVPYTGIAARAALTTAYLMPYDVEDQWFMIPTHKVRLRQLGVIVHEFFHLYHANRSPGASRRDREALADEFLRRFSIALGVQWK